MSKEHSTNTHNLEVIHLGCCTTCGGTNILPTEILNTHIPADVAFKVMNRFYPVITRVEFDEAVRELIWFNKMNDQ